MAKTIEELPKLKRTNAKYPWDDWFNGKVWELTQGVDFTGSIDNFRSGAHASSRRHGKKISTRIRGDKFYIQAKPTPKPRGRRKKSV